LLVSYMHKEQFMPFIICVLVLVLLYTIFKRELGLHRQEKHLSQGREYTYALLVGLIIGVYDGIIGPGTGSFLIFAFIVLFGYDFIHASANAKVVNCVTNIAALSFFLSKGVVVWSLAIPLAAANMLGGYAGAHVALKKGSRFVRVFFIVVVCTLIIKLGYNYIFK
ncbi:MAG TPA: TSUP family transporter, partial [Flavipsychrobacter sp.]|nr:TSUP family transporter [Flavipsychrobacter sp.]